MRELGDVLRVRRLGWFGHVVRRELGDGDLGKDSARCGAGTAAT